MGENSKIEWCDHTWNPWEGCQKVSPACDHCYAETRNARFNGGTATNWGPKAPRRRTSAANWNKPLKWNRLAAAAGRRDRVFCASLADVFDNAVPKEWREDLWALIRATPNLIWMVLTKRPQNIKKMLPDDWGDGYPNVWLGATVEDQKRAEERVPRLLQAPAALYFLSCEPLLGPVDLRRIEMSGGPQWMDGLEGFYQGGSGWPTPRNGHINMVISGGESGPGARPTHPDWHRSLRDQCAATSVPFFFKQRGDWSWLEPTGGTWPTDSRTLIRLRTDGTRGDDGWPMQRVGKKAAGALLDGREHKAMPEGQPV